MTTLKRITDPKLVWSQFVEEAVIRLLNKCGLTTERLGCASKSIPVTLPESSLSLPAPERADNGCGQLMKVPSIQYGHVVELGFLAQAPHRVTIMKA